MANYSETVHVRLKSVERSDLHLRHVCLITKHWPLREIHGDRRGEMM